MNTFIHTHTHIYTHIHICMSFACEHTFLTTHSTHYSTTWRIYHNTNNIYMYVTCMQTYISHQRSHTRFKRLAHLSQQKPYIHVHKYTSHACYMHAFLTKDSTHSSRAWRIYHNTNNIYTCTSHACYMHAFLTKDPTHVSSACRIYHNTNNIYTCTSHACYMHAFLTKDSTHSSSACRICPSWHTNWYRRQAS